MPSETIRVGRVAGLWRYPVKSMAAEPLDTADVGWHGIAGDRRWAFIRPGLVRSGFPWLTIREQPTLRDHVPSFADPARPDDTLVHVTTPAGETVPIDDPALAAALGDGVTLVKQDVGVFDAFPVSVISCQTVAALGARTGRELEVQRFRPNLLVDADGEDPFPEDAWVGAQLSIGGLRVRVDQRDKRCVMVNVDPVTHERDPSVLRTIATQRDARLGVYGTVVTPGAVRVGDAVSLLPAG